MARVFRAIPGEREFGSYVRRFLARVESPVPVWVGGRNDLEESVELANSLYGRVRRPRPAEVGSLLSSGLGYGEHLVRPLAKEWIPFSDLEKRVVGGEAERVLVVGTYDDLSSNRVREIVVGAVGASVGFLTGRDVHSLLWMTAKQYAVVTEEIRSVGFVSSTEDPPSVEGTIAFGRKDLEDNDVQAELLSRPWWSLLLQGHGKDDSVNLGDFTICGLNPATPPRHGTLRPRCGYGWPCYKDPEKLIPLRRIRVGDLVLSACNSGPLPDLALYDPRYLLLLSAIDGCAQSVTTALTVHDSGAVQNDLWAAGAVASAPVSHDTLNDSLLPRHPHPGFWHFGLPRRSAAIPAEQPAPHWLIRAASRLHGFLATDLLPPRDRSRQRLSRVARNVNEYLAREIRHHDAADGGRRLAAIRSDLQSVDYALARRTIEDPEWDLMNYAAYFGERGDVDSESVRTVRCSCGNPAQEFRRIPIVPAIPETLCVFCLRCGDVDFALSGAPRIECRSPERIMTSEILSLECQVTAEDSEPIQVGVFVPSYLRGHALIEQPLARVSRRPRAGSAQVRFTVRFDPEVPPQAYYFTVFAIQNLGLSTHRQHFGIEKP